jgi:hypothetical protein
MIQIDYVASPSSLFSAMQERGRERGSSESRDEE